MTPTSKLRFVERIEPLHPGSDTGRIVRVLQQWWEDASTDIHWVDGAPGEWRDVPLER